MLMDKIMKKEHGITIIVMVILYTLASFAVNNRVLLPMTTDVLARFAGLFVKPEFYSAICATTFRVLAGTLLSLAAAAVLSILSAEYESFARYFAPVHVLSKTIPNISYIILALIWLGSEGAIMLVTFLILFPVYYNSLYQALTSEEPVLKQMQMIYRESFFNKLRIRTLPMLMPVILQTSKTAVSLGFKVGIMAEILGSAQTGIGRAVNFCRLDLDTAGIFAWTIVIILISVMINSLFGILYSQYMKDK